MHFRICTTDNCGVYLLYFVIPINILVHEFCFLPIRNLE